MEKIIRDVIGYEGLYKVSNDGEVYRVWEKELKMLHPVVDKDGYLRVQLSKDNEVKGQFVHRLVANAFVLREHPYDTVVNHKNEIKADNRAENLEWCTVKYNNNYNDMPYRRWNGRRIPVRAIRGDESYEFTCIQDACRKLNLQHGNVCLCLQGKRKTTGGFRWEYAYEQEHHTGQ